MRSGVDNVFSCGLVLTNHIFHHITPTRMVKLVVLFGSRLAANLSWCVGWFG